jgi:hypothetical protein
MEKIVETISKFGISALLVIGGFEVQVVVYEGELLKRATLFPLGQLNFCEKVVPSNKFFQIGQRLSRTTLIFLSAHKG